MLGAQIHSTIGAAMNCGVIGLSILLFGCVDTVVYGEHTGFNLSISVNEDPEIPLQVNAGLKREVVAVVPALSNESSSNDNGTKLSKPAGEAASIFSGFSLQNDYKASDGVKADVAIRTQFASGVAAVNIAGNPQAVAKVVQVSFERDAAFLEEARQSRVSAMLDAVDHLPPDTIAALAKSPPVADAQVDDAVKLSVGDVSTLSDPRALKRILKFRITMSRRDDEALRTWEAALQAVEPPQ